MCRIDYCDGAYIEVAVPDTANLSRCTDCRRPLTDEEPGEVFAGAMAEDAPDLYAWLVSTTETHTFHRNHPSPVTVLAGVPLNRWLTDDDEPYKLWDKAIIEWRPCPDGVDTYEAGLIGLSEYFGDCEHWPDGVAVAPNVHVTCVHCLAARRWLSSWCGGWVYNDICEEIVEHWAAAEVERHLSLGRLVVLIKRKWRRRDGNLVDPVVVEQLVERSLAHLNSSVA